MLGLLEERTEVIDSLALARIAKERETALARYVRDRDPLALGSTMARLDAEEAEARDCQVGGPKGGPHLPGRPPEAVARDRA